MPYTESDVGPKMVGGVAVDLPLAERQAIAAEWNANEITHAARVAAEAVKDGRLVALRALMANRTASLDDVLEFLSLLDL